MLKDILLTNEHIQFEKEYKVWEYTLFCFPVWSTVRPYGLAGHSILRSRKNKMNFWTLVFFSPVQVIETVFFLRKFMVREFSSRVPGRIYLTSCPELQLKKEAFS